ncbi:MAG: ATP-dependent DNA helicase RecG [Muribaculaceae bacterium]|nr:ATP-dependent DNA helicase RecG [Muribaculaceae bacterium]
MQRFEDNDIKYLKGIGESRARLLAEQLEIKKFRDLLDYYPFRYVDRSRFYKIEEFRGEMPLLQVKGEFISFRKEGEGRRRRLVGVFHDGHRMMECVWFSKVDTLADVWQTRKPYVIFGKPTLFNSVWSMSHPEIEAYDATRPPVGLQGIYSMTEVMRKRGITQKMVQNAVKNMLAMPAFNSISETLPVNIIELFRFPDIRSTYRSLHFPADADSLRRARERMKFEELFYLELQILRYSRDRGRKIAGHILPVIGEKFNGFYANCIPFELTGAQKRVLREIRADMRTGRQMNRLIQGDVGSGKTMVAFMTMLMGIDNGFQCALMAPTEILASQHYETMRGWCEQIGLNIRLLTGSTKAKPRREIHAGLSDGTIDILVGTHALIEDNVEFANLGIAVIDEQHRFGVAQRAKLWHKNTIPPHVLVMTATPIPRTLAMTVYGDLDVSVIDELPPGRKPVDTWLRSYDHRGEVNRHIQRQLDEGRQIYIVYPLVRENEKLDLRSLETGYDITVRTFPQVQVAMVHGQMSAADKDAQMQRFVSGEARILVATTVIEVGVNVPNATVMVIENAERFGLSQLHQLRGRVGRGADRSWCILMAKRELSADSRKRLGIMTETSDGFLISEADMKMRGPGDMEGTQQSGIAFSLKMANLATDGQIVQRAREAAIAILDANPELGPVAEGIAADMRWRLDNTGLQIIASELHRRFAKETDWSVIS